MKIISCSPANGGCGGSARFSRRSLSMFLPVPTVPRSPVIIMLNDSAEVRVNAPTLAWTSSYSSMWGTIVLHVLVVTVLVIIIIFSRVLLQIRGIRSRKILSQTTSSSYRPSRRKIWDFWRDYCVANINQIVSYRAFNQEWYIKWNIGLVPFSFSFFIAKKFSMSLMIALREMIICLPNWFLRRYTMCCLQNYIPWQISDKN